MIGRDEAIGRGEAIGRDEANSRFAGTTCSVTPGYKFALRWDRACS